LISAEAGDLIRQSDCIDLHVESFLWTRIFGYALGRRHGLGLLGARLYSQVDFPRLREAGMSGAVWSIVTNPFRRQRYRPAVFFRNLARLRGAIEAEAETLALVTNHREYVAAREQGKVGCWLAIQGGNALDHDLDDLGRIPDGCVSRITLVHMLRSTLGSSSSPWAGKDRGLTDLGREFVQRMNQERILVDLAHISRRGFFDALQVRDKSQPLAVTHTGVDGVHPCWRNIDDEQLRAVADTGGVVGIIFHSMYLDGSLLRRSRADRVVDHMAHVINVAGEDHVALGSDWDGFIVTPGDMKTVLELPVLVQHMLNRGWSSERIKKILGGNYLRMMKALRP
jgi:membrane dipeptidase